MDVSLLTSHFQAFPNTIYYGWNLKKKLAHTNNRSSIIIRNDGQPQVQHLNKVENLIMAGLIEK